MILIIMRKKFLFRKKVLICDDIFFWLNEMNYKKVEEDIKQEKKLMK